MNPAEFFGINNDKFNHIKSFFPQLKISSRGNVVNYSGDIAQLGIFEDKVNLIIQYLKKFNSMTENNIDKSYGRRRKINRGRKRWR